MMDFLHPLRIAGVVAAACGALLAGPAHAADDGDSSAVIVDTDRSLVVVGGDVHPSRAVPENLVATGGRIIVSEPVGRNAVLVGGSLEVRGPVAGKLRAVGGTMTIESTVGAGVSGVGGEVRVARGALITGPAHLMAGTLTIDGRIDGPLSASGERIVINGEVTGDVKAAGESIVLGPGARVGGSLAYTSGTEIVKGEGATIGGSVTRSQPGPHDKAADLPRLGHGAAIAGTIVSFVALLGCGALFLAVAPIFSVEAPDRIKSTPLKALGVGLLTVAGVPILALLFMLTIIGIPVGVMLVLLYLVALLLGFVVGTLFVGNTAASLLRRPPPPTVAAAIGYFALALVVVMLVTKAPGIGGLLLCVLILLGVGAFSVELYRRMKGAPRRRFSTAAA